MALAFLPGEHDAGNADHLAFDIEAGFLFVYYLRIEVADVVAGWTPLAASGLVGQQASKPESRTGGVD
jgi:hypothetical protein